MSMADVIRKEIVTLNLSLKAIISDIQECNGPMEELNDLNKKARHKINEIQRCLNMFKSLENEETKPDSRSNLLFEHTNFSDELLSTAAILKKVTLACIFKIEKASREELLGSNDEDLVKHRKKKDKQELVNMASTVTDRLLSLSRNLSDTTQRSADTLETLAISSGIVDGTREELDSQNNAVSQSQKLLAKYGKREKTDNFLILFATAFFFACVAYVLQKRLF